MKTFRVILVAVWLLLWALMLRAIQEQGAAASWVFVTDFAHPWRAMLNSDFVAHLLLVAVWILWREQSLKAGVLCAAGAALGGMPFTAMYLLVTTYREKGDMRRVLLGRHIQPAAGQSMARRRDGELPAGIDCRPPAPAKAGQVSNV